MRSRVFASVSACFLLAAVLAAQSITGSITGVVTDASGAVIPGAEVTVSNLGTNIRSKAKSDAGGNYTVPLLPRGDYRIEVSAGGFKRFVQDGIVLQVQQTARVDSSTGGGRSADSVMVTADAARLETENATLAKVVDNRTITNMPLNTRNVYSLVFLTPGVTGTVGKSYGEMRYSVNGARARTMDTMIDGVSAAHPTVNGFNGISVFPSVDAIEEFKLLGADYPAEFGRSLGSVLNVVFKSGTNLWHGSAYEFLRNSKLDANNFFDNRRGQPLLSFKRSQFGGVLNGPIRRDKTFFMVSFEALRERRADRRWHRCQPSWSARATSRRRGPPPAGDHHFDPFSTRANPSGGFLRDPFSGNRVSSARFDPVAVNTAEVLPAAKHHAHGPEQ